MNRILLLTVVALLAAATEAQPVEPEKTGLSGVAEKDREFLAALKTGTPTGAEIQETSRPTAVVPPSASVPEQPGKRKAIARPAPLEEVQVTSPKATRDSKVASKRTMSARKALPPKDRTPVRRAKAVAYADQRVAARVTAIVEHPGPRLAAVAEPPTVAAEEKGLQRMRSQEGQTQTIRKKQPQANLWTRIFGPDDDEEENDDDDDDDDD